MLAQLPAIATDLSAADIAERARRMSTNGKLPGHASDPGLFSCAAFGNPFDYRLVATKSDDRLSFQAERLKKLPTIYAIALAVTVWPGVVFTDSLLNTWFSWYPNASWITWAWYIPLTLIPIPWIWRSLARKSQASALVHAHEQIAKIATALDGEVVETT
ncbi:MAG: hypothetical protein AAGF47_09425 [Planctomycetota bacterium]